jgi:uncharacterized membrane protein YgcG
MGHATRIFAAVFGTLTALAGMEHGLGELLQGSVRPEALVIQSWPDSAFYRIQGGAPPAARRARLAQRLASGPAPALLPALAALWPAALAACLAAWLTLLLGIPMLGYFWNVDSAALVVAVILTAFGLLILTAVLGLARDAWSGAKDGSGAQAGTAQADPVRRRGDEYDGRHAPGRLRDALRLHS